MEIASEILIYLIEGAIEGDIRTVRGMATLIAGNLEYEGNTEVAESINSILIGGELCQGNSIEKMNGEKRS